jgi:anti-anti-sigma factor
LVLEGELDVASTERLLDAIDLCSAPGDDVVLDCRALTFLDAGGARALSSIADRMSGGAKLVLQGPSGLVLRVLWILRTDQHPGIEIRA